MHAFIHVAHGFMVRTGQVRVRRLVSGKYRSDGGGFPDTVDPQLSGGLAQIRAWNLLCVDPASNGQLRPTESASQLRYGERHHDNRVVCVLVGDFTLRAGKQKTVGQARLGRRRGLIALAVGVPGSLGNSGNLSVCSPAYGVSIWASFSSSTLL